MPVRKRNLPAVNAEVCAVRHRPPLFSFGLLFSPRSGIKRKYRLKTVVFSRYTEYREAHGKISVQERTEKGDCKMRGKKCLAFAAVLALALTLFGCKQETVTQAETVTAPISVPEQAERTDVENNGGYYVRVGETG